MMPRAGFSHSTEAQSDVRHISIALVAREHAFALCALPLIASLYENITTLTPRYEESPVLLAANAMRIA